MNGYDDKHNNVVDVDGSDASLVFVNRRGEPAYFSVFDNCNRRHTMCLGQTGAGKSMASHEMLQAFATQNLSHLDPRINE